MRALDLQGERFGLLTVSRLFLPSDGDGRRWICACDCGTEAIVRAEYLRAGDTKSCGCLNQHRRRQAFMTHGLSKAGRGSGYTCWVSMKGRCLNPNYRQFSIYGGRGITVCEQWLKFENFIADMGPRPTPRHTIDRINSNGNYEPSNCRWATPIQQGRNRRGVNMVTVGDIKISAIDAIEVAVRNAKIDGQPLLEFLDRNGLAIAVRRKRMDGRVERW